MKVILFGATGMVGRGVLLECLEDSRVSHVLAVGRRSTGVQDEKLREILHDDFTDYAGISHDLTGFDACFFCLGVSSMGMSEERYRHITYDFTLAAARALAAGNPGLVFCYVSAHGADSSERSHVMWARVRGKTENDLLTLPLACAYSFRIAFVQPVKGVTPQVIWGRLFYGLFGLLYPLLRRLFPRHVTTTQNVGRAMIRAAGHGYLLSILKSTDINTLAGM